MDNRLWPVEQECVFRDHLHLLKGRNDILARQLASVIGPLIANGPRTMAQRVCVDQPPLLPDVCSYWPPDIPSPLPTVNIPPVSHHRRQRRFSRNIAHPQTLHISSPSPSSPTPTSSCPAPASSTPSSSTTSPPSASQPLRSCHKSSCKRGNVGCLFLPFIIAFFSAFLLGSVGNVVEREHEHVFVKRDLRVGGCVFMYNVSVFSGYGLGGFLRGNVTILQKGVFLKYITVMGKFGRNWTDQKFNQKRIFLLTLCKAFYKFLFLYTFAIFYIINLTSTEVKCRYKCSKVIKLIKKKRRKKYSVRITFILLKVTIFAFLSFLNELNHD